MPTRPGINPYFPMEEFPIDEQRIIRAFSMNFYVTRRVPPIEIGNASYRVFFMRPADEVSVLMNVEREFAVLFSKYRTFEARTLLAYDRAYEHFENVIVDKSIRFLVSQDASIRESIRHYLQQDLEYPVIIPFYYNGVEIYDPNSIFSKIRQNYLIRDLFGEAYSPASG